ncbi:ABC transporter ATP-binding protein [Sinimarinibacterium sp. CAU 1509]|uniref:ABC transporter ATP-binding protein n=1 Tax=Sinimarinibacterium sp. CAU 1509 TaxID=2562283 RepID=UPI0010ABAA52|nr:ABC transporter ATP-binding protein [Sinimarinibacterium sp. CAU 1509]TJY62126.1 ABC transporter ATP-binding protein [Sinimarinibacterium sp. CAU 1509]
MSTANDSWAIEVKGLSKSFGAKRVVDQLDLQVRRGEIFGFLGPNGSGKTTSIRMLCGLLTPDAGRGQCLGYDILSDSARIKREVGYMTQRFSFYEDLSIRENLEFVAAVYRMPRQRTVVDEALRELGLSDRQKQLAGSLSGGWKQRMALAACLLHRPKLLLLDEPTAGVDPSARRDFWAEIHRLAASGITVLVSTHYMDEAERCHRLAYLAYGKLLAQGSPTELVTTSGLSTWTVIGGDIDRLQHELLQLSASEQVVPFGNSLHVSSADGAELERQLQSYFERPDLRWTRDQVRLEDVFIHLMRGAADNYAEGAAR